MATANLNLEGKAKALQAISLTKPDRKTRPSEGMFYAAVQSFQDSEAVVLARVILQEAEEEWGQVEDRPFSANVAKAFRGLELLAMYPDFVGAELLEETTAIITRSMIEGWCDSGHEPSLEKAFGNVLRAGLSAKGKKNILSHLRQTLEGLGDRRIPEIARFLENPTGEREVLRTMAKALGRFASIDDLAFVGGVLAALGDEYRDGKRHLIAKHCVTYAQAMAAAADVAIRVRVELGARGDITIHSPSHVSFRWEETFRIYNYHNDVSNKRRFLANTKNLLLSKMIQGQLGPLKKIDLTYDCRETGLRPVPPKDTLKETVDI